VYIDFIFPDFPFESIPVLVIELCPWPEKPLGNMLGCSHSQKQSIPGVLGNPTATEGEGVQNDFFGFILMQF